MRAGISGVENSGLAAEILRTDFLEAAEAKQ
jgi:hypothetical protein